MLIVIDHAEPLILILSKTHIIQLLYCAIMVMPGMENGAHYTQYNTERSCQVQCGKRTCIYQYRSHTQ